MDKIKIYKKVFFELYNRRLEVRFINKVEDEIFLSFYNGEKFRLTENDRIPLSEKNLILLDFIKDFKGNLQINIDYVYCYLNSLDFGFSGFDDIEKEIIEIGMFGRTNNIPLLTKNAIAILTLALNTNDSHTWVCRDGDGTLWVNDSFDKPARNISGFAPQTIDYVIIQTSRITKTGKENPSPIAFGDLFDSITVGNSPLSLKELKERMNNSEDSK